jgi:hypothetical protein
LTSIKQKKMTNSNKYWWLVLLFLIIGLGAGIGIGNGIFAKKKINCADCPTQTARFVKFKSPASMDKKPWCVSTQYAYQYVQGDVKSELSPFSDPVFSLRETDPVMEYVPLEGFDIIVWRKDSLNPTSSVVEVAFEGSLTFVDTANPCSEDYSIEAPVSPMENVGGGYIDQNGRSFVKAAAQGNYPWCVPSSYKYQYEKYGLLSAWSPSSDEVKSLTGIYPVFKIPMRTGHNVRIARKSQSNPEEYVLLAEAQVSPDGMFVDNDNLCKNTIVAPEKAPVFNKFRLQF